MEREHECEYKQAFLELKEQIAVLVKRVEFLEAENQSLRNELEQYRKPPKDSGNSSIPPSQDPYRKAKERGQSGKKPGGQPGHKGHFHPFSESPDRIEALHPQACSHCGSTELLELEAYTQARQVVDLPKIAPVVTEYRSHKAQCRHCGKLSVGCFPDDIQAPVQIGDRATGLIGYLKVVHHVSHQRIVQVLADCFGLSVSEGFVETRLTRLANLLEPTYQAIGEALKSQSVLGSDETRNRVNGQNGYVWVFQNERLCYLTSHPSRSFAVIENLIGPAFPGTWISDRYGAQLKVKGSHQLCLAHLLRDLNYAIEAENSDWAKRLKRLLQNAWRLKKNPDFHPLQAKYFKSIRYFENKLARFFSKPPPQREEGKLYRSLLGRHAQLLTFLRHPEVPPDNNGSERALRNRVVHRKVTGGFRTAKGSQRHDILGSVLETAKRQGLQLLDAFSGNCQPLLIT